MTGARLDAPAWLFVPGTCRQRFAKAAGTGAVAVLDLEDAVVPSLKQSARANVADWLRDMPPGRWAVRINAPGTPWYDADLALVEDLAPTVMVPKAEDPVTMAEVAAVLDGRNGLVALVETAKGVLGAERIASAPGVGLLAFGGFDLAAQLGVDPGDLAAMSLARQALVLASAAAAIRPPLDGVTGAVDDDGGLARHIKDAVSLGFGGKLCIHPCQVAPVDKAFRPTSDQVEWARRVVAAIDEAVGVAVVDGQMVDKPVADRARGLLARERSLDQIPVDESLPGERR